MQDAMYTRTNFIKSFRGWLLLLLISRMGAAIAQLPTIGNFSLPTSQQPGPFVSFGQNIVDKNQLIVAFNPSYAYSKGQSVLEGTPSVLYGITDSASILLTVPYAIRYINGTQNLSGIGDLALDLEYAFYNHDSLKYSDQATFVFSPTFPVSNLSSVSKKTNPHARVSGFSKKNAPSNFDAFSYFIGTTYSRTYSDWYAYMAPGVLFIDKTDSIAQGTQYYYNGGVGRQINTAENKYIFFGLLELNGQYSDKTKLASQVLPNTGGSILYATPSLWLSTPKMIAQIGISLPLAQSWYGNQSKISYYASAIITWTIH